MICFSNDEQVPVHYKSSFHADPKAAFAAHAPGKAEI
jgi:hypothetical protein